MTPSAPVPDLPTGLSAVLTAVDETGAAGFVHVGGRQDPDRRYLTRLDAPDRETAVVVVPGDDGCEPQVVYCVPSETGADVSAFADSDATGIGRRVSGRDPATATGQQVRSVLADRLGESAGDTGSTLLVPRRLPHDTAVVLQDAGYDLQSTTAVTTARAAKSAAERERLRVVQDAAATGLARAEAVLADSERDGESLTFEGDPLTAERLRRLIDAELASAGVSPAANTLVAADPPDDEPTDADDRLPAGKPIRLRVAPRGPQGYHGTLGRTVAVDSEGGWERRAFVAAEAGLRAAIRHTEVGENVSTVEGEALAEVGAYGFAVASDADAPTEAPATAAVHGVGLSAYEQPAPGGLTAIESGAVLAVETGVEDPERGAIRLVTLLAVSEKSAEPLVEYPYSLPPRTN